MIRIRHIVGHDVVVPHAILWRPLPYFTTVISNAEDEIDVYSFASFQIGNWLQFEIRHYRGFPEFTASFYLSIEMEDESDIQHAINRAIGEFHVPRSAIAWRRGQAFRYGELPRSPSDRLREPEARLLALKAAAREPGRQASTETLIDNIAHMTALSEVDLRPSKTRPAQPQWHQIVRNVISHRANPNGPFQQGYATRIPGGLAVTEKGMDYLIGLGFVE